MTQVAEPVRHIAEHARARAGSPTGSAARIVAGTSGREGTVYDPATGQLRRHVDFASASTRSTPPSPPRTAAFPGWRATSLCKRTDILFRIRNLVEQHRHELAAHLTAEHGKVPSDALGEIARGLENLEFACGIPNLLKGGFSEQVSTGVDVYQIRQPLGVVAGITPFNFPAMVPMWMFANAIATGNTFILKPSEKDPSAVHLHGRAPARGGRPRRRLQRRPRRQGRGRRHPGPPRHRGRELRRLARRSRSTSTRPARRHGKRVQALGGAKNHMIVLPDADIDMAADAAVSAGYGSAGERCMAIATVVAVGDVADPLVEAITARLPKIKVGPGSRPDVRDGSARHAAASRQGRVVPRQLGRPRARRSSPTAASTRSTTSRTGSSWASR